MKLVHLADLHLGYRQFHRLTPTGRNQREVDVQQTFDRAVDRIVELEPDLVVVAGDVFHTPRPSPIVVREAMHTFKRLTKVVIIAGNHDGPKAHGTTGHILSLLAFVGCDVVWQAPMTRGNVVCVPERFTDDPCWPLMKNDVLLLHGEVQGSLPFETAHAIPKANFNPDHWEYIALGHFHERTDLWPNGGYSGSLDYVSSDIWSEARRGIPKGFIEYDTETKVRNFHPVETRRVVDLPVIDAQGWTHQKMTEAIVASCEFAGLPEGSIVRQRLTNVIKAEWRQADHKVMKMTGKDFLALQLYPVFEKSVRQKLSPAERNLSIEERFIQHLRNRQLPDELTLDSLMDTGLALLREVSPEISMEAQ